MDSFKIFENDSEKTKEKTEKKRDRTKGDMI